MGWLVRGAVTAPVWLKVVLDSSGLRPAPRSGEALHVEARPDLSLLPSLEPGEE